MTLTGQPGCAVAPCRSPAASWAAVEPGPVGAADAVSGLDRVRDVVNHLVLGHRRFAAALTGGARPDPGADLLRRRSRRPPYRRVGRGDAGRLPGRRRPRPRR